MSAQLNCLSVVTAPAAKQLAPGYLLAPFGWAAEPLATMVQADPGLLMHVLELDRPRMHTIALALAHLDGAGSCQLGSVLLSASAREIFWTACSAARRLATNGHCVGCRPKC